MKTILVLGYGKMGKKHVSKLIKRQDCEVRCYDPKLDDEIPERINDNDFVIIVTPIITHYQIYKTIKEKGFNGRIFVEKPAVINRNHFDIFNDKIFVGLIERFNPVVKYLKDNINPLDILNICFYRSVSNLNGDLFFELAIHDLDLFVYLMEIKSLDGLKIEFECRGHYDATIKSDIISSSFVWEDGSDERTIELFGKNLYIKADLLNKKLYINNEEVLVEQYDALTAEHDSFLKGETTHNADLSHDLMLRLLKC